jgi:tol-pal system protein YbgF
MRQQGKDVVGPVANVGTKIDEMATAFQQVQNSMADVTARLGNLEQQMKDLSNAVRTMQTPAAPPPTSGSNPSGPTAAIPPSGTMLYSNANRDRLGGKFDLALQEFNEYLKYYPDDALAPAAQFWIGNIYFTQGDYDNALKAFDLVLERFPANNSKAPDALYWKGKTLMKLDKRNAAATQFREVIRKYSGSEAAANARLQLKQMGLSASTSAARKR